MEFEITNCLEDWMEINFGESVCFEEIVHGRAPCDLSRLTCKELT